MPTKREENERKFKQWEVLADGTRVYKLLVEGRLGWRAAYIKEVDANEITLSFRQEIYDEEGVLRELHEKYPIYKGHTIL